MFSYFRKIYNLLVQPDWNTTLKIKIYQGMAFAYRNYNIHENY